MRLLTLAALVSFFAVASAAAAAPRFSLYVSNERSGDVAVFDIDPAAVAAGRAAAARATWPVGKRPRGIHVSPDGSRLYVAVSGSPILGPGAHSDRAHAPAADRAADGIAVIDPADGRVLRKLDVGSDPEQFALTPDGTGVIVSNEDESTASCWDIATGRRRFVAAVSAEPEGVAVAPNDREVWVTCEALGEVCFLNLTDGARLGSVRVPGRPRSVAFVPGGGEAFVPAEGEATVSIVDTARHLVVGAMRIPGEDVLPMCAVTSLDGRAVYVSTGRGNSVVVIDVRTRRIEATIPVGKRPWGIVLSPDGTLLFAANGKSNDVSIVDVARQREIGRLPAGRGPWGLAVR